MTLALKPIGTALILVGLVAAIPGLLYSIGLRRVHGRPAPATPADFGADSIAAAWERCGDRLPVALEPLDPWRFATRFLSIDPLHTEPGELAAWRIAAAHNSAYPVGRSGWWHLSGAALTIWITRRWSAEEIGATLARDGLCGVGS